MIIVALCETGACGMRAHTARDSETWTDAAKCSFPGVMRRISKIVSENGPTWA